MPQSKKGKGLGVRSTTWEEYKGQRQNTIDEFQKFDSIEDMARYHVALLSGKRYNAFTGAIDMFADRVKAGGYATDSKYVGKLQKAIASMQKGAKFIQPHPLAGFTSYNDYTTPEVTNELRQYFGKNSDNAREIIVKLKDAGWNNRQIAAYLGNVYVESKANPNIRNKKGGDYGLIQRVGDRTEPTRSIPGLALDSQVGYDIDVMAGKVPWQEMSNE